MRLGHWVFGAIGLAIVWALFPDRPDDPPVVQGQRSGATTGYVIEDGTVAWRPMTGVEKFVVNVLSFGQTINSETVNGRTLHLADADSFRVVAGRYGLDQSRVWREGVEIDGADPATFEVLSRGYAHDDARLWKGTTPVLDVPATPVIAVHSAHIVTVNDVTWLTGLPSTQLPERPMGEPVHYCRHWFAMNDAVWLGADRRLPLEAAASVEAIDCDSGVLTRFENGQGTEDLSANDGLLLRDGATLWRLRLSGENTTLATLPEPIAQTQLMSGSYDVDDFLLTHAASGMVYAVGLTVDAPVQTLGQFDSLPDRNGPYLGSAFWLSDTYFTMIPTADVTDQLVIDHGAAERLGSYARTGDVLFDGNEIIAVPGDLPVRLVNQDKILIGDACLSFGDYVTDVPDPTAEDDVLRAQCDGQRRPDTILYDGLRIGFASQLVGLGPVADNPNQIEYDLGTMSIVNTSDAPYDLPASFFAGFELRVTDTLITPPDDAWPAGGVRLGPGESQSWTLQANSDGDPTYWGWSLKMRHTDNRAVIFGDAPFYIGTGQFFGGN